MARTKQARPAKWLIWHQAPNSAGADVVLADPVEFSRLLDEVPPPVRLDAEQEHVVRSEMKRGAAAIDEARKLSEFPRGRHPIFWKPDYVSSAIPWAQESREIVGFLRYDIMLRCQDGDLEGALLSARASFNASRSFRDEPFAVSQLVRVACRGIALQDLERILAHGEPSPKALEEFQRFLEEDEKDNTFLVAARGERGMIDGLLGVVQNGELTNAQVRDAVGQLSMFSTGGRWDILEPELLSLRSSIRPQRAEVLRRMNRLVEIAKLPPEERPREVADWHQTVKGGLSIARRVLPAMVKVHEATHRSHADMRCMIVVLAMERFRRDTGRWPERLDDLTPRYLDQVPLDPFDGKPLKYARRDDGVTVYTVGPDGHDDGGKVSERRLAEGNDSGFRLWDVDKRGQPAPKR